MIETNAQLQQTTERTRASACGRLIEWLDPRSDFNFRHFRSRHMVAELLRGYCDQFVPPGAEAPDFELISTSGEPVRLSRLHGKPVLLHFVSYTCPVTRGGAQMMMNLYQQYGDRVQFIDMVVRQAHPGKKHNCYRSFAEKLANALAYQREESIAWPVLVDDLDGSTQTAFGGTAASVYLIDSEGHVSFCGVWGQSPLLTEAIDNLLASGATDAAAAKPIDRIPHLSQAIVYGRRGPAAGGRRALIDLELGFPGASLLMCLGWIARPVLGPIVLRTRPLAKQTRNLLFASLAAAVGLALFLVSRLDHRRSQR